MSRAPPAWPRPDGGGGPSAPTSRSPSGPPSRVGARPQRARVRPPSSAPPWGRSTGHRRTAASQAARATAPEAQGAARSARSRCADASHPGPRARVRCSGPATARSSAGQSSSPPRHPRSCDPALTTRSPASASSRSDPGPTGASLPDRPRSDDQQPAPWLASAPHGAPDYPLFNNPGILNPSPSPGASISSEYERIVGEIVKLTEIPAPPFQEAARAQAFLGMLRESGIKDAVIDEEGNVMGLRKGSGSGPLLVISSHLDTVFPERTNVKVRREGTRLYAPGVGDASRYLAVLLAMVRALDAAEIRTASDILFVATVGEEGPGDLRGVKHLFTKGGL